MDLRNLKRLKYSSNKKAKKAKNRHLKEVDISVGHGWTVGQKCGTWLDSCTEAWDMNSWTDVCDLTGVWDMVGQVCGTWLDSWTEV